MPRYKVQDEWAALLVSHPMVRAIVAESLEHPLLVEAPHAFPMPMGINPSFLIKHADAFDVAVREAPWGVIGGAGGGGGGGGGEGGRHMQIFCAWQEGISTAHLTNGHDERGEMTMFARGVCRESGMCVVPEGRLTQPDYWRTLSRYR